MASAGPGEMRTSRVAEMYGLRSSHPPMRKTRRLAICRGGGVLTRRKRQWLRLMGLQAAAFSGRRMEGCQHGDYGHCQR